MPGAAKKPLFRDFEHTCADEGDSPEWRAWVDLLGHIHEIPDDETHAEYALRQTGVIALDDITLDRFNGEKVDWAFDQLFKSGWIRVAITARKPVFIINVKSAATTVSALKSLIRLLDSHYAESYQIETDNNFNDFDNQKTISQSINTMIVQASLSSLKSSSEEIAPPYTPN